ncbi:MAG: glycoside hydrolase family 32 protein [Clostridia bacterium]|nr:glycoside hydrolase family 32 protein [Clostridia bacterium]
MSGFLYHFEQKKGWMNDPNGCVFFKGRYHIFFQYRENGIKSQTWWGHAVSDDLLRWNELNVAIKSENYWEDVGCWSGSAIVKNEMLYLFYTSASSTRGQTVSIAYTDDGKTFFRYEKNPVIANSPLGNNDNFRDPKVFEYCGKYYMLIGTEFNGRGSILSFVSDNLFDWSYLDEFYVSTKYEFPSSRTLECPDFFPLQDKWVLKFSSQLHSKEIFIVGRFDGKTFTPEGEEYIVDAGNELYAMQTFANVPDRTLAIGWMWNWGKPRTNEYATRTGMMCIVRELSLKNGKVYNYPVQSARHLLKPQSEYMKVDGDIITVFGKNGAPVLCKDMKEYNGVKKVDKVEIIHDFNTVEIFINDGEASITQWLV